MRLLGEDVAEMLEYVPSQFKVIRHVRPIFQHLLKTIKSGVQRP
jgi:hypothetical protein